MRLIVTRPEPDATRTAEALIRLGHTAILSPMLDIVGAKGALPKELFQAVLVTSSNAVRALAGHPDRSLIGDVPILAVGDQSALEARRAGFRRARSAAGAVADLAKFASAELDPALGPLLYATGDQHAGDLAGELAALGFHVHTTILYRAEARNRTSDVAKDALSQNDVDGILFYSVRSAAAFADALKRQGLTPLGENVTCFCLSGSIANALRGNTKGPILVAARPEQISLFALVEEAASRAQPPG